MSNFADNSSPRVRAFGEPGSDRLPNEALRYLNAIDAATALVTASAVSIVAWFVFEPLRVVILTVIMLGVAAAIAFEIQIMNRLRMRNTSFTVTGDEIYIVRGLFFRRFTSIATSQVLNVEITEGPVLRKFGLVKIRFTCIVAVEPLGPITPAVATAIRSTVLLKQTPACRGV
ncbi:PH domain-containing protein [Cryobacterium lyxosi]|uniref:YdbS-like PH domain-containing protein n=1 Tax=Cryobacterium lyxosi TaxID=1259228 RepID=A0A4R8ZKE5_9MICO|nr:PH domain-containing protein [Cryobacterium lyxosi]TFD28543.1 hypothetical protein E3T27_01125 [Cryobacterium lyxosi]